RGRRTNGVGSVYGFSCVDTKIPLFGQLSKFFDASVLTDEGPLDYELSSRKYSLASFLEADHTHPDLFYKCREYSLLRRDLEKNPLFQYYAVRHDTDGARASIAL